MPRSTSFASHRLRKHADYQRVYEAGRKRFGKSITYFFALRDAHAGGRSAEPGSGPRIGLTVPKAVGKAVTRNRIKRRMRAAVGASLPLLSAPVDLVLHPRKTVADCPFATIEQEVASIFRAVEASVNRQPAKGPAVTQGQM